VHNNNGGIQMNKDGTTSAVVLGLALSAVLPLAARAQTTTATNGVYVGVGGGQSEAFDYHCDGLPQCKTKGSAYRFYTGLQFARAWAVEVAYTDHGKVHSATPPTFDQTVKLRTGEVTLLGQWPATERIALYGKVGAYYAQTTVDTTQSGVSTRVKESNGNPTFAGGIQWFVWQGIAVRGEGQRYMKVGGGKLGDSDYTAYTLGVLWKFR